MTINERVAEKLKNCGSEVQDIIVNNLAKVEIDKRVTLITQSIGRLDSLHKEFRKINRPDLVTYQGSTKVEATSENRFKEIQKLEQGIDSLTKALDSALETNSQDSYNKLSEVYNKLQNVGGNQKPSSEEAGSKS